MALDVDRVGVDGVWCRHIPHRGSVWRRSEPPPDGRWQRGTAVAGFYLADSRETAWAEWYRQIDELALRPGGQLPRDLWRFEVDVDGIADLRSESQLARIRLAAPLPRRHGWRRFRRSVSSCTPKDGREYALPAPPDAETARSSASSAKAKRSPA